MNRRNRCYRGLVALALVVAAVLFGLALLTSDLIFGTQVLIPARSVPGQGEALVDVVLARVEVGDSRAEVLQKLSDAWFHSTCTYDDSTAVSDLFFYRDPDRGEVEIVLVQFQEVYGRVSVISAGRLENYMLHLYDHCTPPLPKGVDEATSQADIRYPKLARFSRTLACNL